MTGFGSLTSLRGQTVTRILQEFRSLCQYLQALFARLLHRNIQIGVLGFAEGVPMPDDYFSSEKRGWTKGKGLAFT